MGTFAIATHLVPVQAQKELEGILEKDLDGGIQQTDCEQLVIGAILDGQDVVGHFQRLGVNQR
jgi:hypothetical protein